MGLKLYLSSAVQDELVRELTDKFVELNNERNKLISDRDVHRNLASAISDRLHALEHEHHYVNELLRMIKENESEEDAEDKSVDTED